MATSNNIISLRRHDFDNLRTFLTGVVVVHHTACTYGGAGAGSLFRTRLLPDGFYSPPMAAFNAFNQSFCMGLFFWMSGRLSAKSLHRIDKEGQSRMRFVSNKVKRLILPALFYTFAINPACGILTLPEWNATSIQRYLADYYVSLDGVRGPVWSTATLFAFDLVAAAIKPVFHDRGSAMNESGLLESCYQLLAPWDFGWVAVAVASFFIRIRYPLGQQTRWLGLQPGYAAQYTFAYAMGHLSFKYGPQSFSGPLSSTGTGDRQARLALASVASLHGLALTFVPALLTGSSNCRKEATAGIVGGWNSSALLYAIWNEFSFVFVGAELTRHFARWYNKPATSPIWQPRYSYAAFLVHLPVSILVEIIAEALICSWTDVHLWRHSSLWKFVGPVIMTGVLGTVNTIASFTFGRLAIDHIPGLGSIV